MTSSRYKRRAVRDRRDYNVIPALVAYLAGRLQRSTARCCAIFMARRYVSAVYAVVLYLSVRRLRVAILLKRLNLGSRQHRHTQPRDCRIL